MTETTQPTTEPPPTTGNAVVDDALARVADHPDLGPAEQAEALAVAHERLHAALDADRDPHPDAGRDPGTG